MRQTHELKTWPLYYEAVANGSKTFELRKNDRKFAVGDLLVLREFNPDTEGYSGRELLKTITWLTNDKDGPWLRPGMVALGLTDYVTRTG